MAMLLQNQAALAKQHIEFLDRSDKRIAESEKRLAELKKQHADAMKEFDLIKSVLARHEKILERLSLPGPTRDHSVSPSDVIPEMWRRWGAVYRHRGHSFRGREN